MDKAQTSKSNLSFWDQLKQASATPLTAVEDSIPLRVMVQIFVFISIGAMDTVASTNNSTWAVPLSAIAAVWAHFARRKRNVAVKFMIAIAMIAMLVIFLGDLVRNADETRLLLAKLLIQLQVLHSFDLPRRKDLGYSIVIGLILMALAATLSQTMIFALWLMAFLVVGLPILLLDHRSRLGVPTIIFKPQKMGLSVLPLSGLLAIILVLGLAIFAFLPRLPGFQLRNFPVSVNISVDRQVPRGGILSRQQPENQQQGGNNIGPNGTGGNGNNNEEALDALPPLFAPEIDTASTGRQLSIERPPELMMRVRSQAELFWRVMSYDEFTGRGWRISRNTPEQIRTIRRSPFNYEFFLPFPPYALGNFLQNREGTSQEVIQTYTITSPNFPNLIPAAAAPVRVFFPSEELDIDLEGMIRSPAPMPENLTYTVISNVVRRNPQLLRQAKPNYPKSISNYYLQLPSTISPEVRNTALRFLEQAQDATGNKIAIDNSYDAVVQIAQGLKQNYEVKTLDFDETNGDLVSQFVAQGGGEQSHFVSALTVMLRSLGIPARYTVGFAPGKFNPFTGLYEVFNVDTQSLVEVFFPTYGWISFDPVPGRPLVPPSLENNRTFGVLQTFWNWVSSFLPSPVSQFFNNLFEGTVKFLGDLIGKLIDMGWIGFALGLAIAFGVGLGFWAVWQFVVWLWQWQRLQQMPLPQRVYQQMLHSLAEQGKPKSPYQTPQEYLQSIRDHVSEKQGMAITAITQIYQDWRYGDRAISDELTVRLRLLLQQVKIKI